MIPTLTSVASPVDEIAKSAQPILFQASLKASQLVIACLGLDRSDVTHTPVSQTVEMAGHLASPFLGTDDGWPRVWQGAMPA